MRINKTKLDNNFTIIDNRILKIKNLSLQAKGLYCIMIGLSEDWNFSVKGLSTLSDNGETATRSAIIELENIGLLERKKYHTEKGYWDIEYYLYGFDNINNLATDNPPTENPLSENPPTDISKTYKETNNKETNNKETNNKRAESENIKKEEEIIKNKNISEVIDYFKLLSPIEYKKFFMIQTQRQACGELLNFKELEEIKQMIEKCQLYNQLSYISSYDRVYKPTDLVKNWQKVIDKEESYKNEILFNKIKTQSKNVECI